MKLKVINAHKKRSSDGSNGQILLYLYVHEAVWVELSSKNRLKILEYYFRNTMRGKRQIEESDYFEEGCTRSGMKGVSH